MNREFLDKGVYGLRHELIGKPCLFVTDGIQYSAIPYGAYILGEEYTPLLTILYYAENEPVEGIEVKVKAQSAISPEDLIPLDPSSKKGQQIYHQILSWLSSNRAGTFENPTKKE